MGLFDQPRASDLPLADRLRPQGLGDVVGQPHLLGEGAPFRRALEQDRLSSMVLAGPPGSGKTTLARLIAEKTHAVHASLNAVTCSVADLRRVAEEARGRLRFGGTKTVLFLDEIHRLARNQQEVLLPYLEDGSLILVGATTENPFFELTRPMLSRLRVVRLQPLSKANLDAILTRALTSEEGLQGRVHLDDEARAALLDGCGGDARRLLTLLETAAAALPPGAQAISAADISALADEGYVYDRSGDMHYDIASAFIKSLRGSDPEAALYWMARMLDAGESPRFIARRLVILASEDIGLAEPQALVQAVAAAQALERVGLPEAALNLSQAVLMLALAPKSNTVTTALASARALARRHAGAAVPMHLRDSHSTDSALQKEPLGYTYPHDLESSFVPQQYLPQGVPSGWLKARTNGREPDIFAAWPQQTSKNTDGVRE